MNICPICTRSYKRPEHLRRHLQSHSSNRPYICGRCGSSFQRTDILRRHQQTCTVPSTEDLEPSPKRVALSPTAWPDHHESSNFATTRLPDLDETAPIGGAPHLSFEHIAGWVVSATSDVPEMDIWQEFLNTSSGTFTPDVAQSQAAGPSRLGFLDKFTSKTGLAYSFDCGTDEQRQDFALNCLAEISEQNQAEAGQQAVHGPQPTANESIPQWLSDPLAFKSHEIIASIKDLVVNKPRQTCITLSWSSAVQDACLSFFSSSSIRRHLELYWALWHPNVNIVHKPTFDPTTSKAYLVAAMCLLGASVSPISTDSASAKLWYNCVEELVFLSDDLCDDVQLVRCRDTGKNKWRRDHLRALQAAYMVLLYQNWEGSDSSKRRIRRLRFSTVVALVRDVGIPNALHPDYSRHDIYDFHWHDFVATEELVRVVLWVFLVDTAFVIFNNLPPRMVITEMSIGPASPESCFQADTAESCFAALLEATPNTSRPPPTSFTRLFETLYTHPLPTPTQSHLASLGPLNLFALTSALHSLVFHHRSSFSGRGSLASIQRALINWSTVWTLYTQQHAHTPRHNPAGRMSHELRGPDMWRRVGFMCHAEEYWWLAKLMVDHHNQNHNADADADADADLRMPMPQSPINGVHGRGLPHSGVDEGVEQPLLVPSLNDEAICGTRDGGMGVMGSGQHDAASALEDVVSSTSKGRLVVEERLRNYDETSMRQINDLIADFRRAEI